MMRLSTSRGKIKTIKEEEEEKRTIELEKISTIANLVQHNINDIQEEDDEEIGNLYE